MYQQTVFERQQPDAAVIDHALKNSEFGPFWLQDIQQERYPTLDSDASTDLAIVGGGYTGLWTALKAKQRDPDRRVMLLEAGTLGWAASGRNGGFCETSLTHGDKNGWDRFPTENEQLIQLGLKNLDAIEEQIAALGIDCDWERSGALYIATEPYQVLDLAQETASSGLEYLDQSQVQAQVASPTYLAAEWNKEDTALIHPAKLVRGLAQAATAAGVEIFEYSRVVYLDTSDEVKLMVLAGSDEEAPYSQKDWGALHTLHAKQVALGTNAFPSLLKRNALMTVPVYDYVLMTEPLSTEQLASIGWQNRQGISDMANQFHYYRLSADNRILFGGYDAIYHYGRRVQPSYENRPQSHRRLASHFFTTFPQLEGVKFSHRWAGAIDTCSRFCAFFGTARGGKVAYAAGFTGLGVGATHFAAEVMLDHLEGLDTERTRLDMVKSRPLPFPPEPLASLGIQAARWSLDQADHRSGHRNLILRSLDALGLGFDS